MIRIGIVGAGENTRARHIPGLLAHPDVTLAGVVNRSPESTARVAAAFQIPRQFARWEDLVADPQIDAVVVGTWPDLHAKVTCAALAAGKHVLTEARMARTWAEAQAMSDAAARHPRQVAMLVPSPFGLACGPRVRELIDTGYLGDLREFVVLGADDQFYDYSQPRHWRQDAAISGINVLTLGILHETLARWVPQPVRVQATTQTFEPTRPDAAGCGTAPITVPDAVHALTQLADGARGLYHFSGMTLFGPGRQIHLYGSGGTLKILFGPGPQERVLAGRRGDANLVPLEIPADKLGSWRVEEEFVRAIRGEAPVVLNTFEVGLADMAFTEAVHRSATQGGLCVELPLRG